MNFLNTLEQMPFSIWVRESSSIWAFPTFLVVHTIGMSVVAGLSAMISLAVLGFWPKIPLRPMERLYPLIWIGFWVNAVSGVLLLIAYPTKALTNPVFYVKLSFIALALVGIRYIARSVFGDPTLDLKPATKRCRLLAIASLVCWTGTITAGRLLAYTYRHLTSLQ